jgi:hypothetical protein
MDNFKTNVAFLLKTAETKFVEGKGFLSISEAFDVAIEEGKKVLVGLDNKEVQWAWDKFQTKPNLYLSVMQ